MNKEKEILIINHVDNLTLEKAYKDGLFSEEEVQDFINSAENNFERTAKLIYQTVNKEELINIEGYLIDFLIKQTTDDANKLFETLKNLIKDVKNVASSDLSAHDLYLTVQVKVNKKLQLNILQILTAKYQDDCGFGTEIAAFFKGKPPKIELDRFCEFIKNGFDHTQIAVIMDVLSREEELSELVIQAKKCIPNDKLDETLKALELLQNDEKGI